MRVPPDDVVKAAQAAQMATGVPASVSLGQWALESGWGERATGKFNFFGVKATQGQGTLCWTHEEVGGKLVPVQALFHDYPDMHAAFAEHAELLTHPRYAPALVALARTRSLCDYVTAIAPQYATDHHYAANLNNLISADHFARFDLSNMGTPA